MKEIWVKLNSLDDVQRFASAAGDHPLHIAATSDHVTIDAKSLMALFSLDLRAPVKISIDGGEDAAEKFCKSVRNLMVNRFGQAVYA